MLPEGSERMIMRERWMWREGGLRREREKGEGIAYGGSEKPLGKGRDGGVKLLR